MSAVDDDASWMDRALVEAARGRPSPNPHVGAVVVRDGQLVAVGHHARAGEAHAEVAALREAEHTEGATLYCTLEPCNHVGRTGPCTDAILEAGVARVVIASRDPHPHVPGAIEKLEAAGVSVTVGVREAEGSALIADFARHIATGLPYTILKAAVTLDGRSAASNGDSKWITGLESRTRAHQMRDRADAVLVGVGTVLADDPSLTVRHVEGRDPVRVVLDTHLRTPRSARVITHESAQPTWVFHGPAAPSDRRAALRRDGVELIETALEGAHVSVRAALAELGRRDVMRLLVEGGGAVHGALLTAGLVSAAAVFIAPVLLGDPDALPLAAAGPVARIADGWRLERPTIERLGDDVLVQGELL